MKKLLLFITLLLSFWTIDAQTNLYEHEKFDELTKDHKTIAIVTFKTQVKLRPKQMKALKEGDLEKLEKAESEGLQSGMHS